MGESLRFGTDSFKSALSCKSKRIGLRARRHMKTFTHRFVIVNRDGVILRRLACGGLFSWGQVEFLPRALEALRMLAEHGFGVLMLCRQSGAAKRLLSPHQMRRIAQRLRLEVALSGGKIEKVYCCAHAEQEGCNCRSADAELIHGALEEFGLNAAETFFVSDSKDEVEAAAAQGCPGILVQRDAFLRICHAEDVGLEIASSLYEAAERIISLAGEQVPENAVATETAAPVEEALPVQARPTRDALHWLHHGPAE